MNDSQYLWERWQVWILRGLDIIRKIRGEGRGTDKREELEEFDCEGCMEGEMRSLLSRRGISIGKD